MLEGPLVHCYGVFPVSSMSLMYGVYVLAGYFSALCVGSCAWASICACVCVLKNKIDNHETVLFSTVGTNGTSFNICIKTLNYILWCQFILNYYYYIQ